MPVIIEVVAETRLTMAITSARVTRLTRGLGADRWPRYRPLARNSRASLVTCVCHRLLLGDPHAPRRRLAAPRPAPPRRPVTPRDSEERSRSSRSSLPRRTCARACSSPLQPLLTMIVIKFVFFFEDQRPSPLPIRLADHERPSPVARSTPESCSAAERERERMAVSSDTGSCVLSCRRRRSSWRCSRRRWRPGVWRSRTTVLLCTSWPPWSCLRTQRQQEHTRSSS